MTRFPVEQPTANNGCQYLLFFFVNGGQTLGMNGRDAMLFIILVWTIFKLASLSSTSNRNRSFADFRLLIRSDLFAIVGLLKTVNLSRRPSFNRTATSVSLVGQTAKPKIFTFLDKRT